MNRNLQYVLILNAVFEGLVGLIMLFYPEAFFTTPLGTTLAAGRLFGMAAITMCALSCLLLLLRTESPRIGVFTLATFHTLVTIAHMLNYADGSGKFQPIVLHGIFAVLFAYNTYRFVSK